MDPAVETREVPKQIKEGDEVLARWADEGWYYRGMTPVTSIMFSHYELVMAGRDEVLVVNADRTSVNFFVRLFQVLFDKTAAMVHTLSKTASVILNRFPERTLSLMKTMLTMSSRLAFIFTPYPPNFFFHYHYYYFLC